MYDASTLKLVTQYIQLTVCYSSIAMHCTCDESWGFLQLAPLGPFNCDKQVVYTTVTTKMLQKHTDETQECLKWSFGLSVLVKFHLHLLAS